MHTESQTSFVQPSDVKVLAEEALVVHRRPARINNQLVIFVHGLNGKRYDENSTWGNFPRFFFDDMPGADVGLYAYRTGFRRLEFWKSIDLQKEAETFSNTIRDDLANYQTIVLVGHSMGGLLCKATIACLIKQGAWGNLARIGGLILMATPQLGSVRAPTFLSRLSSDARVLHTHSDFVAEINNTFQDHLYLDEHINAIGKATIPTWAVQGASDFWVDPLSSGIALASNRKKVVRGSHTDIVKPKSKESEVYKWVLERIERSFRRFKYEVFLSSAMASLKTEEDYQRYRTQALAIEGKLKEKCRFQSVFYAGRGCETKAKFEAHAQSLEEDFYALRDSRYFLLLYPERIVSSVLFEAGWAVALGKPSAYYVRDRHDLPFLMAGAEAASLSGQIKIYEYGDSPNGEQEIFNLLDHHGESLWGRGAP